MRGLFWALVVVAVLFGAPHAAMLLNVAMGPWSARAIQIDGSVTDMRFGRDLPRPDWVPLPADSDIVQASQQTSSAGPGIIGIIEILTRMPLDDAKRFFMLGLAARGFTVSDDGIGTLNQAAADWLGVAGTLTAHRTSDGEQVQVQFRDEQGWIRRSRLVQISWRSPRPENQGP